MPSQYSTTPADLCKHPQYRIGCWSCYADDSRRDLAEAVTQRNKRKHIVQGYEASLTQSDMSRNERESYEARIKTTTEQHAALNQRVQGQRGIAAYAEEQVKHICSTTEPSGLAEKFESAAVEREKEFERIWRAGALTPEAGKIVQLQPEDPQRNVPFKGLDRTSIPATPDSVVNDSIGFQVFIKAGASNHRHLVQAVGEQTDSAIMSYGSALAMFGTPDAPGDDRPREAEPSAECSLEESTEGLAIVEKPEPRTEHDYRLQYGGKTPAETILSNDKQWALFKSNKFLKDAGILTGQYAKLVAETKEASNNEKGKPSEEESAPDSTVPKSSTGSEEWPPVGELEWADFTEWVDACRKADKMWGRKTLPEWNEQRQAHRTSMVEVTKAWKPPQDFDDDSSADPDPRSFFNLDVALIQLDSKKIGLNASSKKNPNIPAGH